MPSPLRKLPSKPGEPSSRSVGRWHRAVSRLEALWWAERSAMRCCSGWGPTQIWIWWFRKGPSSSANGLPRSTEAPLWCSTASGTWPGWCWAPGAWDLAAQEGADLTSDLQRRDYSINALALTLSPGARLLDPTGGLSDLTKRELRALSEANLLADPLRLLRGPRLAAELNFTLESHTAALIGRPRLSAAPGGG